jgi:hypothetical protein
VQPTGCFVKRAMLQPPLPNVVSVEQTRAGKVEIRSPVLVSKREEGLTGRACGVGLWHFSLADNLPDWQWAGLRQQMHGQRRLK